MVEAVDVCDVIDEHDALCSSVEAGGDAVEPLLPRSVPDLQLHCSSCDLQSPNLKVYPYGWDEGVAEGGLITEPEDDAGFPNTRVANQEQSDHAVWAPCGHTHCTVSTEAPGTVEASQPALCMLFG